MAAAAASHVAECPVCHEDFTEPKLLPCTHLVCRKCVLSWLEKGGDQNGCPLCRAPILPGSAKAQGDLASQVDALPTDLATVAVIESAKMLKGSSSSHACSCGAEAALFCLQCALKMCDVCAKTHAKIPSTRHHVTEKLDDLTPEQLAWHRPESCGTHQSRQAELYCTAHEELICVLCVSRTHSQCSTNQLKAVLSIEDAARAMREELKAEIKTLEEREATLTEKIDKLDMEVTEGQAKFKAMRDEIKVTFDDLQRSLNAQREKLIADVQQREDTFVAERKSLKLDLDNHRADLSAHKSTTERLVTTAPDSSLLGMMGKLKARLDAVKSQDLPKDPDRSVGSLSFDPETVKRMKEVMATIGCVTDPSTTPQDTEDDRCPFCGSDSGQGPTYAAVIKVGDRVRRGQDWEWESQDGSPPGIGTVTHVPRNLKKGWLTVKWDCGQSYTYRMGVNNKYDLKFVPPK